MAVHAAFGDVETAWVSDFDTGPNKILAHRYPGIPNLGDITTIDWNQVEPVDIIAGGFPCQDVSTAGRRAGMVEGTRSNLWGAMRTAIETIRPRYVVAENVRGLLSATATSVSDMEPGNGPLGDSGTDNLRALGRVLGDLADLGYDAAWCGLRAADVGAPHGRFRVFILAEDSLRGGSGGRAAVTGDRAGERADTTADRPDSRPDPSRVREVALLPTPAVNDMGEGKTVDHWDEWTAKMRAKHGNGNGHGKSLAIEAQRLLPTPTASEANGTGAHGTGSADLRTTIVSLDSGKERRDATANKANSAEILRELREETGAEALQRTSGRFGQVQTETLLRDQLLPHKGQRTGEHSQVEGPQNSSTDRVRDVRSDGELACPSPRQGCDEQPEGEPSSVMRVMPPEVALGRRRASAFGPYETAIIRWEKVLGRPAPSPTEPGRARPRLSAAFCEWLMGLPNGWVTDTPGITRNEALKALGNGVVPQQGAAALTFLLRVTQEGRAVA